MKDLLATIFEKGTLKEQVVQCLGQSWPLSQKQIYSLCCPKNEFSYQAVYKALHELFAEGVVEKTSSGNYRLSMEFARKVAQYWTGVIAAYDGETPKQKIFINRGITPSAHKYVFGEYDLTIENVPTIFISKSTFHEIMTLMSEEQLERIADLIALKNFNFIRDQLLEPNVSIDPVKYLEKLNEQATTFYWGHIRFNAKPDQIVLKIFSSSFTTEKEKRFYDLIYLKFMKLIGYRLKNLDDLSKSYYFERDVVEVPQSQTI